MPHAIIHGRWRFMLKTRMGTSCGSLQSRSLIGHLMIGRTESRCRQWWTRIRSTSIELETPPAVPRRNAGVGSPGLCDAMTRFSIRQFLQPVELLYRAAHAVISVRHHVEPAKGKDQKHVGRPDADALHFSQ